MPVFFGTWRFESSQPHGAKPCHVRGFCVLFSPFHGDRMAAVIEARVDFLRRHVIRPVPA